VATWTFAAFLIVGALWGMSSLEQFVITDKRFVLEGPPEPGVPDENFQIEGAVHASEQQITRVFLRDFGRSVYLCPVAERRRRLLAIDWVQDATVSRFWPNKLAVRIRERVPVAFVQRMAQDGSTVYGLVDAEGVMLDPQRASKLLLPVLSGMPWKEHESARRDRVKRFLRLQADMGKALDQVSEIDVSDVDNLKVMQVADGWAVTLMLGNQHFLQRFQNYLDNRIEISKRMPNATVLDLRLRDRITAVDSTSENASDSKGSRK
jgi:cell division protein FtsQ